MLPILEEELLVEPDLPHERERLLEFRLGLAAETHDHVGGEGDAGDHGPHVGDQVQIRLPANNKFEP